MEKICPICIPWDALSDFRKWKLQYIVILTYTNYNTSTPCCFSYIGRLQISSWYLIGTSSSVINDALLIIFSCPSNITLDDVFHTGIIVPSSDPISLTSSWLMEITLESIIYLQYKILWKYFYLLAPISVVSAKCLDPRVLQFVVSNITCNSQWDNCVSFDFSLLRVSEPWHPW